MTKATPLALLEEAKKLLAVPEHWTKGAYARLPDGESTHSWDSNATCFCLTGAIRHAWSKLNGLYGKPGITGTEYEDLETFEELNAAYECLVGDEVKNKPHAFLEDLVVSFNDKHALTHAEVIKRLDHAIELAKEL